MAQRHYYRDVDGTLTEMSGFHPRLNWIAQSKAEEGAIGSWTVTLDDPDGELDILGHRQWFVEEDDSEDEDDIIFGGFTGAQTFARVDGGERRTYGATARVVTVELYDANTWMTRHLMRGSDSNRPAETDVERMTWLMSTAEANLIDDSSTYVDTSGPRNMDAADLRGVYLGQVIADCASASGKNHFVWWQKVGGVRTFFIWYGRDTLPDYESPFYITNDRSTLEGIDIDPIAIEDIVELSKDAKLRRSPDRQYCGNLIQYGSKGARTFRHNATTHTLIAGAGTGHRVMSSSLPLVKTKAKAQARGDRQLEDVSEQDVRVTTRLVNIPSTRVTQAKAGMRLQVQGTHWPEPFNAWNYGRIVTAQPKPHGKGEIYDIDLELVMGDEADGPPEPPVPPEATGGGILYAPGNNGGSPPATSFDLEWGVDGDHPGGGYGARPLDTAHFAYLGALSNRTGFEVLASAGSLDLIVQISLSDAVGSPRTYTMHLRKNGVDIATDAFTQGPGPVGGYLSITMNDLAVVAGDELTVHLTTSELAGCVVPWGTGDLTNRFEIKNTSVVYP